jgi:hypothetical protein
VISDDCAPRGLATHDSSVTPAAAWEPSRWGIDLALSRVFQQLAVETARPALDETCAVDFLTRSDLTGRLRGLVILLDEKIAPDKVRVADNLIDASEFGLALELLADWLSEGETPLTDELRADFDRLATKLGNRERVMTPLTRCPVEGKVPDNGRPAPDS